MREHRSGGTEKRSAKNCDKGHHNFSRQIFGKFSVGL